MRPGAMGVNREVAAGGLAWRVTPTESHFLRSHFQVPRFVDRAIALDGAGGRPVTLPLTELNAREWRTVVATLECAGNGRAEMSPRPPGEPWRRGAISTAIWRGIPLAALLAEGHLPPGTVEILVTGADHGAPRPGAPEVRYQRSLPIEKAMDRDVILAFTMNGRPIPVEHGGPARLIVPGWYAMASVKWVTSIAALDHPFEGFFQTSSYVYRDHPVTTLRVSSRVVAPMEREELRAGEIAAWGWAWSGLAPIAGVDLSLDSGRWMPALVDENDDRTAWVLWRATLAAARGTHQLRVRARDLAGRVQPEVPPWNPLGYGNNAIQVRHFRCV
jgi:DMSO/TMAO reductase YedYZ molybdopterin-dependent catalytic subunit